MRTLRTGKRRNAILRVLPCAGVTLGGMSTTSTGRVRMIGTTRRVRKPPPARRWWRDIAGAAAILSVVAGAGLWLADGGIRNWLAPGGPATTLGRLTGLAGSDLLLIQVLLMARIPAVERAYGQDLLARRHRVIG